MILSGVVLKNLSEGGTFLNFNGHAIPVDLSSRPLNHQTLTVRVEATHPSPVLKIIERGPLAATAPAGEGAAPEITTRLQTHRNAPANILTQADLKALNLAEGQSVRARVAQVLDETTVVARVQGKNFIVHTDGAQPLKPGVSLPVTLTGAFSGRLSFLVQSPGPILQNVTPGQLKPYLPTLQPLGELLTRLGNLDAGQWARLAKIAPQATAGLRQTVQDLLPGTGRLPDAAQLQSQIHRSGLDHEAQVKHAFERGLTAENRTELADNLKGRLLQLVQNAALQNAAARGEEAGPSAPLPLRNDTLALLQKTLDNIELSQLSNQYARQDNQPLVLQIPNPFAHGDPTLKLYLRPEQDGENDSGRGGKKHFNLVFLLEMSALGNLRVDSRVSQEGLAVTVFTERTEVTQFINRNAEHFETEMARLGFTATLNSEVRKNTGLHVEEDFAQSLAADPSRLVDIHT